jgi:multicomponent Na+:H+ antiporter subunit D
MTHLLLTLPVLLPMLTAALVFFVGKNPRRVNQVSIISASLSVIIAGFLLNMIMTSGPQSVAFGNWTAPFGIVFVADLLSAAMVMVTTIIGLGIVTYSTADLAEKPVYAFYHLLFHVLLAGVNGAFLTGDIFNLYVWFEVILISSFGLMVLNGTKAQIDGAIKYVVLNLISTLIFLLAIGVLYGATGTLNMADLHLKVPGIAPHTATLLASLFLFAFAIKSALFPLFAWLPASYHTMPSAVVALFAGLLTKVGVYVLIRVFTLIFPLDQIGWQPLLIWIAGLTMLTGVLGATYQTSIKKILSFHIISQIGYMIMGLALYTPLAIAGAIFYTLHHIIVKANLFLIGGVLSRRHKTDSLAQLGGAYQAYPFLSFLFLIPAFSLAGFPPLSGFWGKFLVIKASLQVEHYYLAATALCVGLLTIFSMTKIWSEAFWKPAPKKQPVAKLTRSELYSYYVPIVTLASLTVIIGLSAGPLFTFAQQAAQQLLQPAAYVQAVLGELP